MESNYYSYHVAKDGSVYNRWGAKLKPSHNGRGYLIVGITDNGKRTTKSIHRLLAEVYIPNPDKLSDVDHIDGNSYNNDLNNLRWISHGGNIKHSYTLGNRSATGINNARCITSENDVHNVCFLLELGYSSSCIRDMGYRYSLVRQIKTHQNWVTISKHYSF